MDNNEALERLRKVHERRVAKRKALAKSWENAQDKAREDVRDLRLQVQLAVGNRERELRKQLREAREREAALEAPPQEFVNARQRMIQSGYALRELASPEEVSRIEDNAVTPNVVDNEHLTNTLLDQLVGNGRKKMGGYGKRKNRRHYGSKSLTNAASHKRVDSLLSKGYQVLLVPNKKQNEVNVFKKKVKA